MRSLATHDGICWIGNGNIHLKCQVKRDHNISIVLLRASAIGSCSGLNRLLLLDGPIPQT